MRKRGHSELLTKSRKLSKEISSFLESKKKLVDSPDSEHNLSVHLMKVREEERKAVARDIHDELGLMLAALQLQVSLISIEYKDHERLIARADEMQKMITKSINAVQRICSELRPAMLDILGLSEAMEWQAQEFSKKSGILCNTVVRITRKTLDSAMSAVVFQLFKDALSDVICHSGATRVQVDLVERNSWLTLSLRYNGQGIDAKEKDDFKYLGMSRIREQIVAHGGTLRICDSQRYGSAMFARLSLLTGKGERHAHQNTCS
jgi:signal transduction histidine kinase